ncbi:hypothetical protein E1B28_009590 [Marasmius oreades]|uniref:Protein-S-isoprenylcysteine O-methyltransferase n=1 Tax=Marasmius oreades TaxID=181124 RepID=A0A9P7RVD1_9AGAR|nr:uncharacterized protein E1B28_009590 [Marasmius oreades]KAG7090476.1 hypothetical protein E1B28_009590 [Marasmius oreades]
MPYFRLSLLLKLPLLVSDALCMRITATPPNPPLPESQGIVIPDWRENFLRGLATPSRFLRFLSWSATFLEFIVIVATLNTEGPISRLILSMLVPSDDCISGMRITPTLLLGSILTLLGTLLRVSSYRTLGPLFTFELRIQERHQLVTSGPYSVVRHPSYTGLIMTVIGAFASHASGSWVASCGMLQTPVGKCLAIVWLSIATAVVASLLLRVSREDGMLKETFGAQWHEWAHDVSYSLIPGLY